MEPEVVAVIGLCVFLALWYGGGYLYNRRRGQRLFAWLQSGLDVLGGERQAGWIGSSASGARINVLDADPPFQRLELTLLLENREIPLLWLVDHWRGKRDYLVIKATLRRPRVGEVEVGRDGKRAGRRQEQAGTRQEGPHGLAVVFRGAGARRQVTALEPWLERYGEHLTYLIWRRADPHIQVQLRVDKLLATHSEVLLQDLQTAMGEATQDKS